MSFEAAYSLDTSPPVWVDLPNVNSTPGAPRHGAGFDIEEQNIEFITNLGVRHVYRQFTRNVWTLTFRITHAQKIGAWLTMHEAVDGAITPFFFRIGGSGGTILYCRKEAGYAPRMLDEGATAGPLYDYEITLTEEFDATEF